MTVQNDWWRVAGAYETISGRAELGIANTYGVLASKTFGSGEEGILLNARVVLDIVTAGSGGSDMYLRARYTPSGGSVVTVAEGYLDNVAAVSSKAILAPLNVPVHEGDEIDIYYYSDISAKLAYGEAHWDYYIFS